MEEAKLNDSEIYKCSQNIKSPIKITSGAQYLNPLSYVELTIIENIDMKTVLRFRKDMFQERIVDLYINIMKKIEKMKDKELQKVYTIKYEELKGKKCLNTILVIY